MKFVSGLCSAALMVSTLAISATTFADAAGLDRRQICPPPLPIPCGVEDVRAYYARREAAAQLGINEPAATVVGTDSPASKGFIDARRAVPALEPAAVGINAPASEALINEAQPAHDEHRRAPCCQLANFPFVYPPGCSGYC